MQMISVFYRRLRMRGKVGELPEQGLVRVYWDEGGSTYIFVEDLDIEPVRP